jgi:hypothetical protein
MEIPVFEIVIAEYQIQTFPDASEVMAYPGTPWHNIMVLRVYFENKPDFDNIAFQLDRLLKTHFSDKQLAIRALGSQEHADKSVDQLIQIIKKTGHDRYDPARKGDRYENLENLHIDFFAMDFLVGENKSYFEYLFEPFYFWPIAQRGIPIKIDIAIVYALSKLEVVPHRYHGREKELKKDGYVFKNPGNKPGAILGILKIE